jgi:hypothetical protein
MSYKLKSEGLVTFNSATLSGGYDDSGAEFSSPVMLLRIINDSDTDVQISYDGVTSHDFLPDGEYLEINLNILERKSDMSFFPKGTNIYFKGIAGTGNIYVSAYYLD